MSTDSLPLTFLNQNLDYTERIIEELEYIVSDTDLLSDGKHKGKVRDTYDCGDRLILVTTDRHSSFDRIIAHIPFKGQVLNLISAWWFEQTANLVPNHVLAVPDPNVTVAKKCRVVPIEFVIRGYITGSTNTSLWTVYNQGSREYCGNPLPDGLQKNQKLEKPLLTPTTKEVEHDRPISPKEIVEEGWMSSAEWEETSAIAFRLFHEGQRQALQHGLILVDTKYELGRDKDGQCIVIDEIHTPDSSRYWLADSYEKRIAAGLEPENIDKEFLRLWFRDHCDPYADAELPAAPKDLVIELARRYIYLYERITGRAFPFPEKHEQTSQRIKRNLENYL